MRFSFAYDRQQLANLKVVKECRLWLKDGWIKAESFEQLQQTFPSAIYHPNIMIRLLLFIATLLALAGVLGILGLMFHSLSEDLIFAGLLVYGGLGWWAAEKIFIGRHHYKSGVNEALIYHGCGFIIGGVAGLADGNEHVLGITATVVFAFAAFRYLDLLSTACAIGSFALTLFYELYQVEALRTFIPPVFIIVFLMVYLWTQKAKSKDPEQWWHHNLVVVEALSLLLVYAAGNYLVVRMLSEELLDLYLAPGDDIPLAWFFYGTTVIIPLVYLYRGIRNKDVVMLRVSLLALAFSVFTFKYYFSLNRPELTLTSAGVVLIALAMWLMHYLKKVRNGYTRESIRSSRWAAVQAEALVISQTLGGTQAQSGKPFGSGTSGGGGAGTEF